MPTGFFKEWLCRKGVGMEELQQKKWLLLPMRGGLLVIIVTVEAGSVCKHSLGPGEVLAWVLVSSENEFRPERHRWFRQKLI